MSGLVFGIDLGIGHCGWAVLRPPVLEGDAAKVVDLGCWMFDVPETGQERIPTNQIRRIHRLLRRGGRRRARRMASIRELFEAQGLISPGEADETSKAGPEAGPNTGAPSPWDLRARGLDRLLLPGEWAAVLAHIAKHRGYQSSAASRPGAVIGDDRRMLQAMAALQGRLGQYRTIGEMFDKDPEFALRKRNRDGSFDRSLCRADLADEVATLFRTQRELGNAHASEAFENEYRARAFDQRPMLDRDDFVGACALEPGEKRASRFAPSIELLRALLKLQSLKVDTGREERHLTASELAAAVGDPGATARFSARELRRRIGLPAAHRFVGIEPGAERADLVKRSGEAFHGTYRLRKALGETLWTRCLTRPEALDAAAYAFTFFETDATIRARLVETGLDEPEVAALCSASGNGTFAQLRGSAHISGKAARAILPWLAQGERYDAACSAAGYAPDARAGASGGQVLDKTAFNALVAEVAGAVAGPAARKAITEGLKQVWALRNDFGVPDAVHLQLAPELGCTLGQRREIERSRQKSRRARDKERREACSLLAVEDIDSDCLLRYRLWKDQAGRCPYSGAVIPLAALPDARSPWLVDHILPWSRFADDSFANTVLCAAAAGAAKGDRTPCEWLVAEGGEQRWRAFIDSLDAMPGLRAAKRRKLSLEETAMAAGRSRNRHLEDSRYTVRLMVDAVERFFAPERSAPPAPRRVPTPRRVIARPARLTEPLRRAWGIELPPGSVAAGRVDLRRHALVALVVAALGDRTTDWLAAQFKERERAGRGGSLREAPLPWGHADAVRSDLDRALDKMTVARPERRRARGEGHGATIRQVRFRDGKAQVYERKPVSELAEAKLDELKDLERNAALAEAVRNWITGGRPEDRPPRSPAGDVIRKVRVKARGKPGIEVRGGTAERSEIVRVDVFAAPGRHGRDEYYLVPVYGYQVMNRRGWPTPPSRAAVAYKSEATDWLEMDDRFAFRFSLYPRSLVEVVKQNGTVLRGYFQSMNRATAAINLVDPADTRSFRDQAGHSMEGIGVKTVAAIRKFSVDRLGRCGLVRAEQRTWHGRTVPDPRGEPSGAAASG